MRETPSLRSRLAEPLLRQRADAATLVALFVLAQLMIPARLVLRGLPISLTLADVLGLFLFLCWLCAQFTTTLGAAKGRIPIRTALFVYGVGHLIIYGYTTLYYLPQDELNLADHSAVLIAANLGMALAVCDGVRGRERLDLVLKTVAVSGALISVIGGLQFMFALDLTQYMVLPGLRHNGVEGIETLIGRSDFNRVASTLGHPIEFGVVCSMLLPIAAHYGFHARDRGQPAVRWWVCTGLIAAGLMFSVSRSAVLGLGSVALVLLLGWPGRRRLQALGAVAAFLVVIKFLVPGLLGTLFNLFANLGSDDSVRFRTHDYSWALAEIEKRPWLGRGVGTWYAPKHQVFDNQYLLTLVEAGAVGLALFVGVALCGMTVALRIRARSADPRDRNLALTLAACLLVPLVCAATFDLLSYPAVTALMFLLVGATGALHRATKENPVPVTS
ncbi:O-antigen ligase family protein [Planobispora longispora]|uniref:O-antigen ligase family protein n=1 Tax=Planobispora longispora TaxID=28887 RepID=UPI0036084AD2